MNLRRQPPVSRHLLLSFDINKQTESEVRAVCKSVICILPNTYLLAVYLLLIQMLQEYN